ncbi:MAG: hypothetical protein M3N29_09410 [Chloroflexota bacterium]|nr:hypothetical protein [Chloroflexota bacterium]
MFERVKRVPRELLEDRWTGLMEDGLNPTELRDRLTTVLFDLATGLTRRDVGASDNVMVDGTPTGIDVVLEMDGLEAAIREWLIERASRPGVSL